MISTCFSIFMATKKILEWKEIKGERRNVANIEAVYDTKKLEALALLLEIEGGESAMATLQRELEDAKEREKEGRVREDEGRVTEMEERERADIDEKMAEILKKT